MANNPFFLRHFRGDEPGKSGSGQPMSNSPDIILTGTTPAKTLGEYETEERYKNEEPPDTMIVGSKETNYVYVRTRNFGTKNATARLWLWYAEPGMLLWPQNWMYDKFQVAGESKNWTEVEALPNAIKLGNAFELVSPEAPKDHYCMIAMAQSPVPNPKPEPPFPGYFPNIPAFAQWIQETPYAAWRNTIDQPRTAATWNSTNPFVGPSEEETFNVGVQCKNIPVGSKYRFVIPGGVTKERKEWETVDSEIREVKKPNESVSLQVTWPAGVNTTMTITYYAEGKEVPAGAIIEPVVGTSASSMEGLLDDPLQGSVETLLYEKVGDPHTAQIIRQHIAGGVPNRLV